MKTKSIPSLFLVLLLIACKEGATFDENLKSIEDKQQKVVLISKLDLSSEAQYAALKDYFRTVADLSLSLKTDPSAVKYWAAQVKGKKITNFCAKYVLAIDVWKNLGAQCLIDGQFLCPDEVKEYPTILKVVLENSPQSLQNDFANDPECSKWKGQL